MKLGMRIFGCYLIIFIICFYSPVKWVSDTLNTRYREAVEDSLADQANMLAEILEKEVSGGKPDVASLNSLFGHIYARDLNAQIYELRKTHVDLFVYITDTDGRVIFDSAQPQNIGADFSGWRDVKLTLEGKYGARSTLANSEDPSSSVLYVAAPIRIDNNIAGVLTVGKPTTSINNFIKQAKPRMAKVALIAFVCAAVLSYLAALWMTRPIKRLTAYAEATRDGLKIPFPKLDSTEIGDLGRSLQSMQATLEGKSYIEQYVQRLTHEVKSPLSAIRGAAELLEEDVPPDRRKLFLTNIRTEAGRIQTIVDRMLELAALETKKELPCRERIELRALIHMVIESKQPILTQKSLTLLQGGADHFRVTGDPFLLHQALSNLLQNAIDFSAPGSEISVIAIEQTGMVEISFIDSGSGIPEYALEKIFDKFFSLQRPDSGKKSTGLGLNLVKEVALLHEGDIRIMNHPPRGVKAVLSLPIST